MQLYITTHFNVSNVKVNASNVKLQYAQDVLRKILWSAQSVIQLILKSEFTGITKTY